MSLKCSCFYYIEELYMKMHLIVRCYFTPCSRRAEILSSAKNNFFNYTKSIYIQVLQHIYQNKRKTIVFNGIFCEMKNLFCSLVNSISNDKIPNRVLNKSQDLRIEHERVKVLFHCRQIQLQNRIKCIEKWNDSKIWCISCAYWHIFHLLLFVKYFSGDYNFVVRWLQKKYGEAVEYPWNTINRI